MTGAYNVDDDDDECVVIEGSALHEHMTNLGYTDFEIATIQKPRAQEDDGFTEKSSYIKTVCEKLYSIFSWITKAEDVSKQQLSVMTNVNVLLDDHSHIIHNSLEQIDSSSWRNRWHNLMLASTVIISSTCVLFNKSRKISSTLFLSSTLLIIVYVKCKRLRAKKDLETLVSLQNEAFELCRRGLKILKYNYRIAPNRRKGSTHIYGLAANRLQYFQPITECVVKFMESMSLMHYKISLLLTELLPQDAVGNDLPTKFEQESFNIRGEITYQELKELYYIYILTQSEMLYLLSTAYNINTWTKSCCCLPEEKLAHIVHSLLSYSRVYKDKLSTLVESYCNYKVEQTVPTYTLTIDKKWQDLYVHLHLTSNKLQAAYNHILSILEDIDNDVRKSTIYEESVEKIMLKLNQAYQDIDGARNFAEFSSLLVARTRIRNCTDTAPEVNAAPPDVNLEPRVIRDADPEIVDEVFEEYIKEEYLKPLYEEGADSSLEDYKWDKFLAKSFLSELRDALIDKKKSMSERESKALQRMYQKIVKDMDLKENIPRIPKPPPLPNSDDKLSKNVDESSIDSPKASSIVSPYKQRCATKHVHEDSETDPCTISFVPLPPIERRIQITQNPISFPPSFLKAEEETFIGSGENSEEEQSDHDVADNEQSS